MAMTQINSLSKTQASDFFNSFDNVLFDCDGVIFLGAKLVPGADDAINGLGFLNKRITYVSNNSFYTPNEFINKFNSKGIKVLKEQIILPTTCLLAYLKRINFQRQLYLIASQSTMIQYEQHGFMVYRPISSPNGMDLENVLAERNNTNIGAVVVDLDLDVSMEKLSRAQIFLTNSKDVQFLVGASDNLYPVGENVTFIGPGNFANILTAHSGRKPKYFSKPSEELKNYIFQELNIENPNRTLFVGDSLQTDMPFATLCNFQKLLVLSGTTKMHDLEACDPEILPHYVADSVQDIADKFKLL